jgi:hypothetical protein
VSNSIIFKDSKNDPGKSLLKTFLQILHSGCESSVQELVKRIQEFVSLEDAMVAFGLSTDCLSTNALRVPYASQTPVFLPCTTCTEFCCSRTPTATAFLAVCDSLIMSGMI